MDRACGAELADDVVIISMASRGGQLAHVLAKYKYGERSEMRKQFTDELAYVLATFLVKHRQCLGEFDLVIVVPSTRQRTSIHPLIDILSRRVNITRYRFAEALTTSSASLQSSAIAPSRAGAARVVGLVIGRRVDAEPSGTFDWDVCALCQQV